MPIYEYECSKCGTVEEIFQKFSDKPLTKCKRCSGKVHKLISHSSFHLKGSGWYVTDYANTSKKSTPASTKQTESAPTAANESKPSTSGSAEATD
jgi:putative FmdB family regulatory protein